MPVISPPRTEAFRFSGGTEYRVSIDSDVVLQIEKYPRFYSAYWRSDIAADGLVSILGELGEIPSASEVILAFRDMSPDHDYTTTSYTKLLGSEWTSRLSTLASFLRINADGFSVTWHRDELTASNIVGFIDERRSEELLAKLYNETTRPAFDVRIVLSELL